MPIEETATIDRFQHFLEDQIAVTPRRIDVLWEAAEVRYGELAPVGARPVLIEYPWGRQMRWAVEGHPGLWGATRMQELTGVRL